MDKPRDDEEAGGPPHRQLPHDLFVRVLQLLPPNEVALSGRLACKDAAQHLHLPHHCTVLFSQPLPPHAASSPPLAAQQAIRQLSFRRKLWLLSTAASSGCVTNLALAWQLLHPSLFPELLQLPQIPGFYVQQYEGKSRPDPGTAALRSGHPHLLPWLLQHCRALLHPQRMLAAAAAHCDLAALQSAWRLLVEVSPDLSLNNEVLEAAAGSATPDAVAKVEWVLREGAGSCRLMPAVAEAAAGSGDLGRLQWLAEQGCPGLATPRTLMAALRHAPLGVCGWLAEQEGCLAPSAFTFDAGMAAAASGSVTKLQWLQAQGVPLGGLWTACHAARHGQVDTLRFLLQGWSGAKSHKRRHLLWGMLIGSAVASGSIPTAEVVLHAGCPVPPGAYGGAMNCGAARLGMVRWLIEEARCPFGDRSLGALLDHFGNVGGEAGAGEVLAMARLLLQAGCPLGDCTAALNQAAFRGDLGLVRFLHEECGCAFSQETLPCAAAGGCEAVLEWLVSEGGVRVGAGYGDGGGGGGGGAVEGCWTDAGRKGDLCTLECLRRLEVPWCAGVLAEAVSMGCPLAVLRWMVGQGAPAGRAALEAAVGAAEERARSGTAGGEDGPLVAWLQGLGDR